MIHVDEKGCIVTGPGDDVMAELGHVISATAKSLERSGADKAYLRIFFHRLVDIAMDAPDESFTLDLSTQTGGLK